jgi:sulfatase modifying factor 1
MRIDRAALLALSLLVAPLLATTASEGVADAAAAKRRNGKKATKKARTASAPAASRTTTPARTRVPVRVAPRAGTLSILPRPIHCPADMVAVAGRVCVDRFETAIVDASSGEAWSPFYTPDRERARETFLFYAERRERARPGSLEALLAIPALPSSPVMPRAISAPGVLPQGYLSGDQADAACRAAGKRLCTESEWLTACRGQERRDFPYGDRYQHGVCNVWRESHPSSLLHGNAARYHDDPRNGLVEIAGRAFLQPTGASLACASRWGDDAVFDMVGNLDEWVADPDGVFLGGFYARASRAGCLARVGNHVRRYSDYSTGTRCCADPSEAT